MRIFSKETDFFGMFNLASKNLTDASKEMIRLLNNLV